MVTDEQYEELQRLIAELAKRIYKLEQLAQIESTPPLKRPTPLQAPSPKTPIPTKLPEPDLESKIGGQWLNRLGIFTVLIGVSYFLKYAFDNEWVGPAGRVLIGLLAGMGVVIWSEYVRRRGYEVFSYSLKAVGIGALYLSLWASSQVYYLVPTGMAFAAMMGVSAATVAMALWQNAEVIAAFGMLGAFITPAALSTGENHADTLFAYLALLDAVALVLISRRHWARILMGSFLGTVVYYCAWNSHFYTVDQFTTAFLWVTAFFILFASTPFSLLLGEHRNSSSSAASVTLIVVLFNATAYSSEVWQLVHHLWTDGSTAAGAAGLGTLYFVLWYVLNQTEIEVEVAEVHAAIGAALLMIAVPLAFDASWITVGWLVEGAALVEVSDRTRSQVLRFLGGVALILGTSRVLVVDNIQVHTALFNERMLVSLLAVAATGFAAARWKEAAGFLIVTMNVVALVALHREITDAFGGITRDFADSALLMLYGAGLMVTGFAKDSRFLRWHALVLIGAAIAKVFLWDTSFLDVGYRVLSFTALGVILLATSFLYQRNRLKVTS
jgi:uncharacterized membrane protein